MIRLTLLGLFVSLPATAQVTNIAPSGTATQSSTWVPTSTAPKAIDGNTSGLWVDNSIQHTDNLPNSWWQVDFSGQLHEMYEIRMFPRFDCCHLRQSNFRLSVYQGASEVWGQDFYVGSGNVPIAGETVTLPGGTFGDRVRIQIMDLNNEGTGYMHFAEIEIDGGEVGTSFCSPAQNNSTGGPASIIAIGTTTAGGAPFGVIASGMPSFEFGYFLCGMNTGSLMPPGSAGVLCLSGNIGRFNTQIRSTLGGDSFGIQVDTTAMPVNPTRPVMSGETWYFQAWFRDGVTSNFSDAVCVTF